MNDIGHFIKFFRKKRKMTQVVLAEKIGKSQECVSSIERGKRLPSVKTLIKICNALNVKFKVDFVEEK